MIINCFGCLWYFTGIVSKIFSLEKLAIIGNHLQSNRLRSVTI